MKSVHLGLPTIALALAACSNDSVDIPPIDLAGTDTPATFATPEDGAKAAAALLSGWYSNGLYVGISKAAQPTGDCNGGGTSTFDSDDSTNYAGDGRYESHHCLHIDYFQGQVFDRIINDGVRTLHCEDGDECRNFEENLGEGGTPQSTRFIYGDRDQLIRVLRSTVNVLDDSGNLGTSSGYVQYDNLRAGKSGLVLKDQFVDGVVPNSGDQSGAPTSNRVFNGVFAVSQRAADTANCLPGRMQVETIEPLAYSLYIPFPQSGHLRFTSANGTSADVVFHSDAPSDIGINGAEPTPFTPPSGPQYCMTD